MYSIGTITHKGTHMIRTLGTLTLLALLSACGHTNWPGTQPASIDQFPPHTPYNAVYTGPAVAPERAHSMNDYYWRRSMGEDVSTHPYHVHAH